MRSFLTRLFLRTPGTFRSPYTASLKTELCFWWVLGLSNPAEARRHFEKQKAAQVVNRKRSGR